MMPENHDALELFSAVRTQWRGAGFGVIGLDYTVLYREADDMEIELSPCIKAKIRAIEAVELKRMNKKTED